MRKITIIILFSLGSLFAQQTKPLGRLTYPTYDFTGEVRSKLFTMDGSVGLVKSYAKIEKDSLFITNEYCDIKSVVWKVEHARIKIGSLLGELKTAAADTVLAENKDVRYLLLYGSSDGGFYERYTKSGSVEYPLITIGIFFKDEKWAQDFIKGLQ